MTDSAMDAINSDNLQPETGSAASADVDHPTDNLVTENSNSEQVEPKCDVSIGEMRNIMEVMAATGRFWHDWGMLKGLLSFWMKQVLAEYYKSQIDSSDGLQKSSSVIEAYPELVKRLDEALFSFTEGPPFTLQRLCEILLSPKSTYSNLSKLALALEKNLSVTSTLTMSSDPYPGARGQNHEEPDNGKHAPPEEKSTPVPNGVETTTAGDGDEEMTDAEPEEDPTIDDTEMQEEKVSDPSTSEPETVPDGSTSSETGTTNEQQITST